MGPSTISDSFSTAVIGERLILIKDAMSDPAPSDNWTITIKQEFPLHDHHIGYQAIRRGVAKSYHYYLLIRLAIGGYSNGQESFKLFTK